MMMTGEQYADATGKVVMRSKSKRMLAHLMRPTLEDKTVCGRYSMDRAADQIAHPDRISDCGACNYALSRMKVQR